MAGDPRPNSRPQCGRRGFAPATAGVILGWLTAGCRPDGSGSEAVRDVSPDDAAAWFEDVTAALGVDFVHDAGTPGTYFMPEAIGSGVAFFDADGDARLDVYLIQNGVPQSGSKNRFYRQEADGKFRDVSAGSGLDIAGRGMGVAAGDANNDGLVDVVVTDYGDAHFFTNLSGGRFEDATRAAGIDNPFWGSSASFFDFDRDGWLDLVIANYVIFSPNRPCTDQAGRRDYCGPQPFPGTAAKLFRNAGARPADGGSGPGRPPPVRFEDVTVRSGLARATGPGLGVLCADFTGDRWPDVFVANDGKPNFLWVNRGNGTFEEEAVLRGMALNAMGKTQANMGIAVADVEQDGLLDLYVTHLTDEHHILLRQGPRGYFHDATGAAGLARPVWPSTGFGTVFADFDLDGDPDLAQANGRVKFTAGPSPPGAPFWDVYRERNQVFENVGGGAFRDVSPANAALCGAPAVSRSIASGDFDEDGDVDLLVTRIQERPLLLRNVAARKGAWLTVRAVDDALGGRDMLGAEVIVRAGGKSWLALVQSGQSYLASCDPRVHLGLGAADRVDSITVAWPDGTEEEFDGGPANRSVTLRRGQGRKTAAAPPGKAQ